jgi:hypothetical protein
MRRFKYGDRYFVEGDLIEYPCGTFYRKGSKGTIGYIPPHSVRISSPGAEA